MADISTLDHWFNCRRSVTIDTESEFAQGPIYSSHSLNQLLHSSASDLVHIWIIPTSLPRMRCSSWGHWPVDRCRQPSSPILFLPESRGVYTMTKSEASPTSPSQDYCSLLRQLHYSLFLGNLNIDQELWDWTTVSGLTDNWDPWLRSYCPLGISSLTEDQF